MNKIGRLRLLPVLLALVAGGATAAPGQSAAARYDVVVYGGTASGALAAIAAAREGASVVLLEPGRHIGGMVSGGLSHTDYGDRAVIGGMTLEYYRRVGEHYRVPTYFWRGPEPRIAERILVEWLRESGVTTRVGERLAEVDQQDARIRSIRMGSGNRYEGNVFIDATYEGDLMAWAGVSYVVGREGVKDFNESLAGRQPFLPDNHQFRSPVSPFVDGRDGDLLPLVNPTPPVAFGEADEAIQGYGFRLVLTRRPDNRVPFTRPAGYDPNRFELLRRYMAARPDDNHGGFWMVNLPNEKAEVNDGPAISTNLLDGSNWAYPDADPATRQKIWDDHLHYVQSLMYFFGNDPAVPERIRREMSEWGLAKDEFVDTDHWPHQLYVRTGRRMVGEYFMTQHDLETDTLKYDAIGMGSYNVDVRHVQRTWMWMWRFPHRVGETFNEGYISWPVPPYEIPYRSIVPKYSEIRNLLVPVCLSSSHIANASIRMEPQYMILGEAAGAAAALAVRHDVAVQRVPITELQETLRRHGQVLSLEGRPNGVFQTDDWVVLDDDMSRFVEHSGRWSNYENHPERHAMSHASTNDPGAWMRYAPQLLKRGRYRVLAWWPSNAANASATPFLVRHLGGVDTLRVNQRENGGRWVALGEWDFDAGRGGSVEIRRRDADGTVVADAIRFELLSAR
jgi:hypothetical protein